ncbi:hypothetical protein RJ639_039343 [Escallonia herrerae]|uniref:Uncharacterized protein n=1 Tax=Escallonia herrerae TaxID=1293975 RepID=A0AA89B506_9ASTE|nr:hypothetical protein RJ639_039343 [Escallonia herrerae]
MTAVSPLLNLDSKKDQVGVDEVLDDGAGLEDGGLEAVEVEVVRLLEDDVSLAGNNGQRSISNGYFSVARTGMVLHSSENLVVFHEASSIALWYDEAFYNLGALGPMRLFCRVRYHSWLGMLPGTWAYVSAGAFGRAIIRGIKAFKPSIRNLDNDSAIRIANCDWSDNFKMLCVLGFLKQEESNVGLPGGNGQLLTLGVGLLATALAAAYVTQLAKIWYIVNKHDTCFGEGPEKAGDVADMSVGNGVF